MEPRSIFQLPLDWDEWRREWQTWRLEHAYALEPRPKCIPGKNLLADEIIGTFCVLPTGRTVELSEVTFPDLTTRDARGNLTGATVRGIGLTFADDRTGNVVHSWPELETALGLEVAPS